MLIERIWQIAYVNNKTYVCKYLFPLFLSDRISRKIPYLNYRWSQLVHIIDTLLWDYFEYTKVFGDCIRYPLCYLKPLFFFIREIFLANGWETNKHPKSKWLCNALLYEVWAAVSINIYPALTRGSFLEITVCKTKVSVLTACCYNISDWTTKMLVTGQLI